jgi:transposase, IS111A/IS1328/IS1533
MLLIVDQPKTIGALPVAIAQNMGIQVAYLPGLTMRRVADLHPGEAKTDARDAFIIAETARTMAHTLHAITVANETTAELSRLCGFDDDLAAQATAVSNRLRGFLAQIHPHLERVLGPRLSHRAVLALLEKYPAPADLKTAGKTKVRNLLKKKAPRLAPIISVLAMQLELLLTQRAQTEQQILSLVEAHPASAVIRYMPGMGVRTSARILTEVVDKDFKDALHLASYAGIAPVDRKSGTSIKGSQASRRGNKALKRVLFLSAFASLKADPASRAYYDRKCSEGKRHNQVRDGVGSYEIERFVCDTAG